jgi:hypothetical protein
MSTAESTSCLEQIGHTAGVVWHLLDEKGPQSLSKLAKTVDAPRDTVMQAVGWLAREEKLCIEETKRGRTVSLR